MLGHARKLGTPLALRVSFELALLRVLEASLVAQRVENKPTMQETWVRSLNREDPLEK